VGKPISLDHKPPVLCNRTLSGEGRVYGGGLHKLEPKELANVPVPEIAELFPREHGPTSQKES